MNIIDVRTRNGRTLFVVGDRIQHIETIDEDEGWSMITFINGATLEVRGFGHGIARRLCGSFDIDRRPIDPSSLQAWTDLRFEDGHVMQVRGLVVMGAAHLCGPADDARRLATGGDGAVIHPTFGAGAPPSHPAGDGAADAGAP